MEWPLIPLDENYIHCLWYWGHYSTMNQIRAEASGVIDARPEQVYAVLSDYREGHPAIVPERYFKELTFEEGDNGDCSSTAFT